MQRTGRLTTTQLPEVQRGVAREEEHLTTRCQDNKRACMPQRRWQTQYRQIAV